MSTATTVPCSARPLRPSRRLRPLRRLVLACGLAALVGPTWGQAYPSKPIRYVVPYAPGGGTDLLARLLAERISAAWNVPVLVENRPGAAGRIGTEAVARAAPDGYTMLMAINSHALNASLFKNLGYDPIKDFAPVALVATSPNVLSVHPASPITSVRELIAAARARPGALNYASGGPASGSNLAGELFKMMAKVDITEVPYKGAAPAMADLLGGQVTMSFVVMAAAAPHLASGKLRALAVTSAARSPLAPSIPTVAESGLPGYDVYSWFGTLAPAGTPPDVIARWNREIARIVRLPDVQERLAALGMETKASSPQEFERFIREDWALWDKLVKTLGIKLD